MTKYPMDKKLVGAQLAAHIDSIEQSGYTIKDIRFSFDFEKDDNVVTNDDPTTIPQGISAVKEFEKLRDAIVGLPSYQMTEERGFKAIDTNKIESAPNNKRQKGDWEYKKGSGKTGRVNRKWI